MKGLSKFLLYVFVLNGVMGWGFFSHQKINRLAIFTLPPDMIVFYKKHISFLTEAAVNPDRRRYAVKEEGPRHFIDLDAYADTSSILLPRYWKPAVSMWCEDTLQAHGVLPWHIDRMYRELKDAFMIRDPSKILRISAELGHYVADAHVPLHTTCNYDGQDTGQSGIHAFWESRLPELYFVQYDFLVGKAEYISNVQLAAWNAVIHSHAAVDSVLEFEKQLSVRSGGRQFSFETKGKRTVKVVAAEYAGAYHKLLSGMVERQLRASIKMTADIWFTAWVDAGQPDLKSMTDKRPTEEELKQREMELKLWKERNYKAREHESEE